VLTLRTSVWDEQFSPDNTQKSKEM